MQYAILFYEGAADFSARDDTSNAQYWSGWSAYSQAVSDSGQLAGGACLHPGDGAATLKSGTVLDGPYAETKEQLGGFFIVNADNLDEALAIAARSPAASSGAVEVRPVRAMSEMEG
ncbi:YciI family protein [Hyphobacterium sp.]|uniref:YciI family protein n=1 Tax=Hyphobacterium sp. TaxID=2004662 RepID=UPI003B52D7E2